MPGAKIETLGNFLRHEYRDVDPELIWSITRDNLRRHKGLIREKEFLRTPQPEAASAEIKIELERPASNVLRDSRPILVGPSDSKQMSSKDDRRVEVGDTVKFRYLTDDKRTINVTISKAQSDTSRGIIHHRTPVAAALLGAEVGDEVEVLVGSYIRPAIVERISKGNMESSIAA